MKSSNGNSHVFTAKGKSGALALQRMFEWSKRKLGLIRTNEPVYNFSDIEESPTGAEEIQKLVREAGQAAASEARAVGIPKVFAKNGQILKQWPDGRIEVVFVAEGIAEKIFFKHVKSRVLHARKK